MGCDTLVALGPATSDRATLFAKNSLSDRGGTGGPGARRLSSRAPGSRSVAATWRGDVPFGDRHLTEAADRRLRLVLDQEPLHGTPRVARDAEQDLRRRDPAVQVVVDGREAQPEVVGEGFRLVGDDFAELPREGGDADGAHDGSPFGLPRQKKGHRSLRAGGLSFGGGGSES